MLVRFPALLCYSVDDNLGPKLDYFVDTLGFTQAEVGAMATKFPSLWSNSLQLNIAPKVTGSRPKVLF